jgi:2-methylfumaryl-CoA isomerase
VASLGYVAEVQLTGAARPRLGNAVFGTFVRDFDTSDGRSVVVAAITPRQWRALVQATGAQDELRVIEQEHAADLALEGERFTLRDQITRVLRPWFESRRYAEVAAALDENGVLWGRFQSFAELVREDPRCSARNPLFAELNEPGAGSYLHATTPLDFSRSRRLAPRSAPTLGEHTDEVLGSWLGLGARTLSRLAREGVVA